MWLSKNAHVYNYTFCTNNKYLVKLKPYYYIVYRDLQTYKAYDGIQLEQLDH